MKLVTCICLLQFEPQTSALINLVSWLYLRGFIHYSRVRNAVFSTSTLDTSESSIRLLWRIQLFGALFRSTVPTHRYMSYPVASFSYRCSLVYPRAQSFLLRRSFGPAFTNPCTGRNIASLSPVIARLLLLALILTLTPHFSGNNYR